MRTLRRHDGYVRFAKLRVIRLAALSVHSLRNVHKMPVCLLSSAAALWAEPFAPHTHGVRRDLRQTRSAAPVKPNALNLSVPQGVPLCRSLCKRAKRLALACALLAARLPQRHNESARLSQS